MHKIKKILFYLLLFYTIFGFFILPFIIKSQLIQAVETNTYTKLHVKSVYVNPFLFRVEIDGFALEDLKRNPLVSFDSFCFNFEPHALVTGVIRLKKIALEEPYISVVMDANKSLNLLSILKPSQKKSQEGTTTTQTTMLPRVVLDDVQISNGVVAYKDFTHKSPFDFTLDRIGFRIEHFDTQNKNRYKNDGTIRFYATLGDGGFIDLKTQLDSFSPLALHGSLDFEASKLYTQWRYLQDMLNLEVADGKISLHTEYRTSLDDINATQITNTAIKLSALRIKPKTQHPDILDLDSLTLESSVLYPLIHKGKVERIALQGLHVKVKREDNGVIDWSEYTKLNTSKEQNTQQKEEHNKTTPSKPWDIDIDKIALDDIDISFKDNAIKPYVQTDIEKFSLHMDGINTLGVKPLRYELSTLINHTTPCHIDGKLTFAHLDVTTTTQCKNFDIVHYNPYIKQVTKEQFQVFDLDLKSAYTSLGVTTHIYDENGSIIVMVEDANVRLDKLKVAKKTTQKALVGLKSFQVHHAKIDTTQKDVTIQSVLLERLSVYLERYKNKKLNIDNLVVAKRSQTSKKIEKKGSTQKPYHIVVKKFHLKQSKVLFKDSALVKTQRHSLDRIDVVVKNIDSHKGSWLDYKTTLRINKTGKLYARGKLRAAPLKERGYFSLKNLPLSALTPYLQESTYIDIYDGRLSMTGHSVFAPSKHSPDLRLNGNFKIDSLFINNTQDNSFLFSMNQFLIKSYTLELNKNRLFIDEIDIDSFYINAKIDEHKVMNLATLVKKSPQETNVTKEPQKEQKEKEPFPISIVKVNVTNGSAKFSDFSIPIKFQTDIHDLNGVVYAISNRANETTYVKLKGEVDKYGSTLLKGSLDGSDPKKYTDIDFNFKNLNLSSLSGYSAEFAGYKIDSGKLFLDLGYDIHDGKLLGSNSVIIKKIKLGDEIEDENVTHLPLGFVIGLLEDSDGIIDIDMPVEGDVDKPDFKYGTLIWKTFTNLIAKAVTSPFKFLGSMLGMDGEALEFVVFEANSVAITPPQREKLDKLAKMMLKRPKIALHVIGAYDKKVDTLALQKEKLIALVIQKSGDKNVKDKENALTIEMLEAIYKEYAGDEKLKQVQKQLQKNYKKEGSYKRVYQKELVTLCTTIQKISQKELEALGYKRARAILHYLSDEKQINKARLSLAKENIISDEKEGVMVKMEIEIEKVK